MDEEAIIRRITTDPNDPYLRRYRMTECYRDGVRYYTVQIPESVNLICGYVWRSKKKDEPLLYASRSEPVRPVRVDNTYPNTLKTFPDTLSGLHEAACWLAHLSTDVRDRDRRSER